jgi:hypothetical protein
VVLHHAVGFVFALNSSSIVAAALAGSPCAGDRQTSVASVKALAASGKVSSLDPMQPAATPALKPSGIVVNCPIMATVRQPSGADRLDSKGSGSKCERSPLGYDCVVRPQPEVAIHYSLGSSQPPSNPCTTGATGLMMEPMTPAAGQQPVVERFAHFAVESSAPGFVAMSFPQSAGKMWPADAVIGSLSDDGRSAPRVQAYHLTRYGVSPSDQNDGWVQHRGYVSQGGSKVVCFSRALDAPEAAVVKSISPSTGGCNKVQVECINGPTNLNQYHVPGWRGCRPCLPTSKTKPGWRDIICAASQVTT